MNWDDMIAAADSIGLVLLVCKIGDASEADVMTRTGRPWRVTIQSRGVDSDDRLKRIVAAIILAHRERKATAASRERLARKQNRK